MLSGADKTAGNAKVTPDKRYKSQGGLKAGFRSVQQNHTKHPLGATHCMEGGGDGEKTRQFSILEELGSYLAFTLTTSFYFTQCGRASRKEQRQTGFYKVQAKNQNY